MEPSPPQPQRPPRRRWQFSLATLFLFITAVCLILSRFYPRVYASAQIQIPAMTAATVPTYMGIVRSHRIVSGAAARCPEMTELAGVATTTWIRARVEVRHVEKDILEICMSGRPRDRDGMQKLIDALAEEYVGFLVATTGQTSDETIAMLQESYDKLKASNIQLAPAEEVTRSTGDHDLASEEIDAKQAQLQTRRAKLLQSIAERIAELKTKQKQLPPPKVIRRSSGWDL